MKYLEINNNKNARAFHLNTFLGARSEKWTIDALRSNSSCLENAGSYDEDDLVLFIVSHVVQKSIDNKTVTFQMKAIKQSFYVMLFIMLYKVVISVDEIVNWLWPFKWKLLSSTFPWCCLLRCTGGSNFWVREWNPEVWPFTWKLLSSALLWSCGLF